MVAVRPLSAAEAEWTSRVLEDGWGSTIVARRAELIDAAELPGFVAERAGERVGLVTYADRSDGTEIVTIQSLVEGAGVGRALMDAVLVHCRAIGSPRLWLVTTNDNLRAYEFYQRWGLDLVGVEIGGVEHSRRLKPGLPQVGASGLPLRHELIFAMNVT